FDRKSFFDYNSRHNKGIILSQIGTPAPSFFHQKLLTKVGKPFSPARELSLNYDLQNDILLRTTVL
ncbi:MAG: hypothetical protein ACKO96_16380, partial [Flammeovirgaceae bacterium]